MLQDTRTIDNYDFVPWPAAYHGFGHAEVDVSSTITNNLRFPGQYFDAETNLLSLSYGYDANGNVTSITDTIGSAPGQYIDSTTYAYESGTNRLTTITGTPTATLTHDAGGNIITEGTRTFTYDLTNRLTAVTDNETQIASYVYDARNLRVKKATPSETRIFHYDVNGHLIAETDGTGVTLAEHVYLSDMPLATVRPTDTVYYFHTDHINTPRVITNSAGTVAWQAAYHGFGHAEVDGSSTITNNLRFPGQYFDAETNLHYNWNRYYDPRTGRYLTPDPIGLEGGIDPYVYTENRPINEVDPEGLRSPQLVNPFVTRAPGAANPDSNRKHRCDWKTVKVEICRDAPSVIKQGGECPCSSTRWELRLLRVCNRPGQGGWGEPRPIIQRLNDPPLIIEDETGIHPLIQR